ncbi:hypothetical protein AB3S75_024111 [Citrus x aurantiifolia]
MVPAISRLISLFLLVFILLHEKDCCTAHTKKYNVAADGAVVLLEVTRTEPVNVEKVIFDGVPTGAEVVGVTKFKGRKMTSKRSFLGKETVKEDVLNQEESTIPGAAHVINGNCKRKRKGSALNVERKLRNRSRHHGTNGHHKVKMAGFAAFSADYHVPKSHPPRNN